MYLLPITSKLLCGCYGNQKRRSYEKISLNLDQLWKTWGFVSLLISFYWKSILNQHLFVQRQQWQQQHDVWNRFKVNNKDNRKTPLTPTAKSNVIWPNLHIRKLGETTIFYAVVVVFIFNFELISNIVLMIQLLTLNK